MKVKVGDKVYDGENEPVMVILTEQDKKNITNMIPDGSKYSMYPDTEYWTANEHKNIKKWMSEIGE